jgi:hypothetical protein
MPPTDDPLRELAKRRVQVRHAFVIHTLMYLVVNAGLIAIWAAAGRGYPWFLFPMIGWGAAVVAHGIALVIGPDSAGEARAIERELQRLRHQH